MFLPHGKFFYVPYPGHGRLMRQPLFARRGPMSSATSSMPYA